MESDQYFAFNPIIPRGTSRRNGSLADEVALMEDELERTLHALQSTKRSLAQGRVEVADGVRDRERDRYDRERHDGKPSPDKVRDILERELAREGRELRDSASSPSYGRKEPKGPKSPATARNNKETARHVSPKPMRSPSPSGKQALYHSQPASPSPLERKFPRDKVSAIAKTKSADLERQKDRAIKEREKERAAKTSQNGSPDDLFPELYSDRGGLSKSHPLGLNTDVPKEPGQASRLHNSDSFASKNSTGSTTSLDWKDGSKDNIAKDPDAPLKLGEDPLCAAIKEGNVGKVKKLVRDGADVNKRDEKEKNTPLGWAVIGRHFEVIKYLVKMGSEINQPSDAFGYTPLILSINHQCDSETVQYLLDHGADPLNCSKQKTYPLHFACKGGSIAIVEMLLNQPIVVLSPNSTAATTTHPTPMGTPTATIDINQKDLHGWTPLHYAVKYNHDELTGFLLHHGADFKLTDNNNISPLKLASISPEISKVLEDFDPMSKYWSYVFDEALLKVDLNAFLDWDGPPKSISGSGSSPSSSYLGSLHGTPCCVRCTPNPKQNHQEINRVRKDMGLMSGCQHPNLLTFLGTCLRKSQPPLGHCVVTEYCDGDVPLSQYLPKHGKITFPIVVGMALDWARGVAWLHSRKPPIVNINLVPRNVIVSRHGECRVFLESLPTPLHPSQRPLCDRIASDLAHFGTLCLTALSYVQGFSRRNGSTNLQNIKDLVEFYCSLEDDTVDNALLFDFSKKETLIELLEETLECKFPSRIKKVPSEILYFLTMILDLVRKGRSQFTFMLLVDYLDKNCTRNWAYTAPVTS